jgi:hypothetical protein
MNVVGATRRRHFELRITRPIDTTEVATTIVGSDVTSNCWRNSASRVALPAMNCAVDAAAHVMAMTTAEAGCGVEVLIRVVQPRPVGA